MKVRWIWMSLLCVGLMFGVGCGNNIIDHQDGNQTETTVDSQGKEENGSEEGGSESTGTDGGGGDTTSGDGDGRACKEDCDCDPYGLVCEKGVCSDIERRSSCLACDGKCLPGRPCKNGDGTYGTCKAEGCTHDCDCKAQGQVCVQGFCSNAERASTCVSCDGKCTPGEPCWKEPSGVGTCAQPTSCKHDCDCESKDLGLCDRGICRKDSSRNSTNCIACGSTQCKVGDPCINKDRTIGTCDGSGGKCTNDCDCPENLICLGTCTAGGRNNQCAPCNNCKEGERCRKSDGTVTSCVDTTVNKCNHDCDCVRSGGVCESRVCNKVVARASTCVSCDGKCTLGAPCSQKDQTVGVCAAEGSFCKNDCDCAPNGGVCHNNKCTKLINRANNCPACGNNCQAGLPCRESNGTLGVCPGAASCKEDCDCYPLGLVCEKGKCAALRRASSCPSCDGACRAGFACYNKDQSIGVCGPSSCKHDCDCDKYGAVCQAGKCDSTVKRASSCVACGAFCQAGQPCKQKDGSIGVCGPSSCKHDCDCDKYGAVCQAGKCDSTVKRASSCVACGSFCQAGQPCKQKDGSIGVCPVKTFACGPKQCKSGKEYCDSSIGGARPSCEVLPPQNSCPSYCNTISGCRDGKVRCYCPSFSCRALPPSCTSCACLKSSGTLPKFCSCQEKNGEIRTSCPLP